jgi:hypothetical protein
MDWKREIVRDLEAFIGLLADVDGECAEEARELPYTGDEESRKQHAIRLAQRNAMEATLVQIQDLLRSKY